MSVVETSAQKLSSIAVPGIEENTASAAGCVHELFEQQCLYRQASVAIFLDDQSLTYGELNRRANQLAWHLRERGVGPDVLVGLCMERSLRAVVALLGILKAGGAYVPLDPAYPKDRIAYIVSDSRCRLLITDRETLDRIPQDAGELLLLDEQFSAVAHQTETNPHPVASPQNLAYVIYTSGSTGKPKGVQIEHHSVVNFLLSMQRETGICETDVVTSMTTLCFDIAGLEIYLPLVTGARIAIIPREDASDGKKLQSRMLRSGATIMQATPATWRLLLESGWSGDNGLKVICGGEAMPRDLANKLVACCGSVSNMYGPTETTIWSSVYKVTVGDGGVPIGHPILNTTLHVLDEAMQPVPNGQEGHLVIGGAGVARGYFNRPDLTQEKFVHDPFSSEPNARLYKTGDLARFLPDGNLLFLGRIDHQVKIRGFRIELGEIEHALSAHSSVKNCVVVAREDTPEHKRLVAYIVPVGDRPIARELREFLETRLPEYMIPAAFVVLAALPLTPNGKIDRKVLPAPTRENSALDRIFVAPRNSLEKKLARIWEAGLKIKPIGISDNIFELGVDSVIAAQLFAQIEKKLGMDLPPAPLFKAPTIESLAALLNGAGENGNSRGWTSLVELQPRGSKTPLFCVHGGAGTVLLFHPLASHLAPERPVYAFQAQGLYGRELPHTNFEEMAAHYIKEMRTVQPQGPYLLTGWCSGGIIAFEMAQQLARMGEQVAMLATLNAPSSPEFNSVQPAPLAPITARLERRWQEFRGLSLPRKFHYLGQKSLGQLRWRMHSLRLRRRQLALRTANRIRPHLYDFFLDRNRPIPGYLRKSYFTYIAAVAEHNYRHQQYHGNIVVFRDQQTYPDPLQGWGRFVHDAVAYEIPVDVDHHRGLLQEPAVRLLAEKMEEHLRRRA
jgi:amino acid adenylation domain-containing protein